MYYEIILYDRQTERMFGRINVPPALEPQALAAAGIHDAAEPGEVELHDKQVRALAELLRFSPDFERFIYHFETILI
jgi:hypothetical protein